MNPWDRPETPHFYEEFCERYDRYRRANAVLIARARLKPTLRRLMDLGAGTGRTTEAALSRLGPATEVMCVEPSPAMRQCGMARLADRSGVRWVAGIPDEIESFDRILCGAAIWQLHPLPEVFRKLSRLLRKGGSLCFNIPAIYLQEPDDPGGGGDPHLLALPPLIRHDDLRVGDRDLNPAAMTASSVNEWLCAAGLRPTSWTHRMRISQEAYAAWMKIPVLTERLCGSLTPEQRAKRIDASLQTLDRRSWKWERWRGWTAWK